MDHREHDNMGAEAEQSNSSYANHFYLGVLNNKPRTEQIRAKPSHLALTKQDIAPRCRRRGSISRRKTTMSPAASLINSRNPPGDYEMERLKIPLLRKKPNQRADDKGDTEDIEIKPGKD